MFYFDFNSYNKKEYANKFIISGSVLLTIGLSAFFFKNLGVRLISYGVSFLFLFLSYLNLVNINDRKRYQSKKEVRPYELMQIFLIFVAFLFLIFPEKIQGMISVFFGVFTILKVLGEFLLNKNNLYYRFNFSKIFSVITGFVLIISPLFLSKFIVSMMAFIISLIGINVLFLGTRMRKLSDF